MKTGFLVGFLLLLVAACGDNSGGPSFRAEVPTTGIMTYELD